MQRVLTTELEQFIDKEVVICGWVHRLRELGGINFLILRDRAGVVQVVISKELIKELSLQNEMSVKIVGKVVKTSKVARGLELQAKEIKILGKTFYGDMLPLEINNPQAFERIELDTLLNYRGLSLRNPKMQTIFKLQGEITRSFREFSIEEGFTEIHTPKLVATGTEGGADLFEVKYFDSKAYLAQSPQFYKQIMVGVFERVFEIGSVYRAEKHETTRHLNEYVSMDWEIGFIESFYEVMDLEGNFLKFLLENIKTKFTKELKEFNVTSPNLILPIPKIKLKEALEILEKKCKWKIGDSDLDPEGEKRLSEFFLKETGSDFIFVTHYPWRKRPMYTMPDPEDQNFTLGFDLLFRGLEITTGSQRIHDYEKLKANIEKFGLSPQSFSHYLEVFKYGMPPHGGLAIGLERLTCQLLKLPNIRLASLFPRDRGRLTP